MIPIAFVDTAVNDLTPRSMRLPPMAWSTLALFGKARSVWRYYRSAELYSNPQNFAHLLAGHIVGYAVGDRLLIKVAAHSLLVATRVLECVEAQGEVKESFDELWNALWGRYTLCVKETWPKKSTQTFGFSFSTVMWWNTSYTCLSERVSRIIFCFLKLIRHSFELSMLIADTIDAFYLPSEMQNQSVPTCFINAAKWLQAITSNKEQLLDGLSENKTLIERIIQHSPFTYDQLYNSVSKNLERIEWAYDFSHTISNYTGETVFEISKRAMTSVLVVLGGQASRMAAQWE